ncbi:MAG: hypothetical protein EON56_02380 [Alphaproteobacteria bacterium]|nr:MAG: hypothetical protein EON56_02380 [Alphaproteobacteria bacterium]
MTFPCSRGFKLPTAKRLKLYRKDTGCAAVYADIRCDGAIFSACTCCRSNKIFSCEILEVRFETFKLGDNRVRDSAAAWEGEVLAAVHRISPKLRLVK